MRSTTTSLTTFAAFSYGGKPTAPHGLVLFLQGICLFPNSSNNSPIHPNPLSPRRLLPHLSVVVTKMEFFIRHQYYPSKNSLTWTLDYSRQSDIDDSCGFWYVIPHPSKPNWTRVYYSVEVSMFDWVPKVVIDILSKKALTEATGWVKKHSEVRERTRESKRQHDDVDITSFDALYQLTV